jgi:hypothetical protein
MEIEGLKAQLDAEKRVTDVSIPAPKLAAESAYYEKLDEQRRSPDGEKRRLCALVINTFGEFFNLTDTLTETAVTGVLMDAKAEVARLAAADRAIGTMLLTTPRPSRDDAVAQVLLKKM